MKIRKILASVVLLALVLPGSGLAQQMGEPPPVEPEDLKQMHPLDQIYYEKERKQEYIEQLERNRRMREMESWDNQRRLVKRQLLDVKCTWKFSEDKSVTKVFKKRTAPTCEAAIKELSQDLNRPLSADCSCQNVSPVAEVP